MNLGENIYNLRVEKNLSQGGLADALEVSRQSVSKWENNSAVPELDKLVKMAEIFGVTIDQLVTGKAPSSPPPEQSFCESPASLADQAAIYARRTVGIVLLSFGLLAFLVCLVLSITVNLSDFALLLPVPFAAFGLVLALVRHNPGYYCCLLLYFPAFSFVCLVSHDAFGLIPAINSIILICFAALLLFWTVKHFRSDKLHVAPWGKVLMILFLAASMLFSLYRLILCMFPSLDVLSSSYIRWFG